MTVAELAKALAEAFDKHSDWDFVRVEGLDNVTLDGHFNLLEIAATVLEAKAG